MALYSCFVFAGIKGFVPVFCDDLAVYWQKLKHIFSNNCSS